ncbi:hypothetical protein AVEN_8058-1 [Araneus ventricosus]|uniref:Uncharacterized protein n=1 Tax=Araneus ventricosus TaxID=182803 RepID=A0A4Y2TZZ3_ARAVE|nr:hypothetical protein AVEN_8058-1 [Araneus ventricosus]
MGVTVPQVPRSLSEAVVVNGYIYAIGYRGVTNPIIMVQVYDLASDRWSSVSAPRFFKPQITAVAFRGLLYLIGGKTIGRVPRSMDVYDPVKGFWISMPDFPIAYFIPRKIWQTDFGMKIYLQFTGKSEMAYHSRIISSLHYTHVPVLYNNRTKCSQRYCQAK